MASEKNFENKIKKYIESEGGWQVKFFANAMTRTGIPDLLCCINGYFLAIEVKAENGHPSEIQQYVIGKIRDAGGVAVIVYPSAFDELKNIVQLLKRDEYKYAMAYETILKKGGNA
jgi:Holliday junction resolvase